MNSAPPCAPAAARNAEAILGVLRYEFAAAEAVLEIGSGTGQHAVHFAAALGDVTWQTSDLAENHEGIRRQIRAADVENVLPPLLLDMQDARSREHSYDAVFSANTLHIMPQQAGDLMMRFVAGALGDGGTFCCYGPFRRGGAFTSTSNEAFDRSLRSQDARMGLRDLETVVSLAAAAGLESARVYAMPANNLLVAWRKKQVSGDR